MTYFLTHRLRLTNYNRGDIECISVTEEEAKNILTQLTDGARFLTVPDEKAKKKRLSKYMASSRFYDLERVNTVDKIKESYSENGYFNENTVFNPSEKQITEI